MAHQTTKPRIPVNLYELADTHLLDDIDAARALDVSPGTLGIWRSTGRYNLPFVKIGRKVRYRAGDLRAFLAKRTRTHTGEGTA